MTLANPLGMAAFADLLHVADVKFRPSWNQERSLTGGGETLYADRAPMLWMADVTSAAMTHADAKKLLALINSRGGGLLTILLYDHSLPYPSPDPTGSLFGAATPVVGTITDRTHTAFTGFPASYSVPAGTYFQIIFGSTRYYLGQFCEDKTASGAGAITATEIAPAMPASIAAGAAVTVLKPSGKFRIIPGSANASPIDLFHSVVTFSAEQTYSA
jgi:hypothetical protein